jgi:ATP-dependent Clp protease ATP-binding subunit ClpA
MYGARPMRRAVERCLEDPLAEEIIRGRFHDRDPVAVSVENGKLTFTQNRPESSSVSA